MLARSVRHGHRAVRRAVQSVGLIENLEDRRLLSGQTVWAVRGPDAGSGGADTIVVQASEDGTQFQAVVNSTVVATRSSSQLQIIRIYGGRGNDVISVNLGSQWSRVRVIVYGGDGNDSITGGPGTDTMFGGRGNDSMDGQAGDDWLFGGSGDDLLAGDAGSDYLFGQTGNDVLVGGLGADALYGQAGNDELSGGFENDVLSGGGGADVLRGGGGADQLDGGRSRDTVFREDADYWRHDKYDTTELDDQVDPLDELNLDELKQWLIEQAVAQWKYLFDRPVDYYPYSKYGDMDGRYTTMGGLDVAAPTNATDPTYSETNTQEANVDEADLVKTDGQYLYVLRNDELLILDSWPAEEARVVAQMQVKGWPAGIYLEGDKVVVLSTDYEYTYDDWWPGPVPLAGTDMAVARCFWPRGEAYTYVTTVDVADRANPQVSSQTKLSGSLATSRGVDGRMYLVTQGSMELPRPRVLEAVSIGEQYKDMYWVYRTEEGKFLVYESEAAYRDWLASMPLENLLPKYIRMEASGDGGMLKESTGSLVEELYVPRSGLHYGQLFSVVAIDLDGHVLDSDSVAGFSGEVYASEGNLYVTSQTWSWTMARWGGERTTEIYKFAMGADEIVYEGVGRAPGWILNQFSMDEENGLLRVATTTDGNGRSNNVLVMEDKGATLEIVGGITGLALNERIYSARFFGDAGYIVTFRQVDPLFKIDFSDPREPVLAGVLEIPGYSSYLHPIGEDLLLGFGRDADESGRIRGLKVSLFDVSGEPEQLDVFYIPSDTWWMSSTAEWDHHAFSYFPEHGVLAVPVSAGSSFLQVIKVDTENGLLSGLGQVAHTDQVLRSVQIGDFLYSVGTEVTKVVDIYDPSSEIAEVLYWPELPDAPQPPGYWWPWWRGGPILMDGPVVAF